jgi:succinoglycan biosynthesis protein ExoA
MINSTTLFRRAVAEKIGGYEESLLEFADWDFWLKMGLRGKLYNFPEHFLYYRVWSGGSSFLRQKENAISAFQILNRHRGEYPGFLNGFAGAAAYLFHAHLPAFVKKYSSPFFSRLKKYLFSTSRTPQTEQTPSTQLRKAVFGGSLKHDLPTVSIVIPTFNEELHLEGVIRSFQKNGYAGIVEILIADGGSSDQTEAIVERMAAQDRRIKLLHNPERIQSAGLNRMLGIARGDVFLRADAHNEYAEDYVEACVDALKASGAACVGGAQRFVALNAVQLGIALAVRSFFGSGGAKYRNERYEGFAETVFLGCFWREELLAVNGYAAIAHNQDTDLCIRLTKASRCKEIMNEGHGSDLRQSPKPAGSVFVSPRIRVWYYPRTSLPALGRQYFAYGRARCGTMLKHGLRSSVRGTIPFMAFASWTAITLWSVLAGDLRWLFIFVGCPLAGLGGAATVSYARNRRAVATDIWRGNPGRIPLGIVQVGYCFFALGVMLSCQSSGFGIQLLKRALRVKVK